MCYAPILVFKYSWAANDRYCVLPNRWPVNAKQVDHFRQQDKIRGRDLPRLARAQAMNFQNLGAIADFVSSVLVLITLIYIAVQTNHARRSQLSIEQHAVHSGHRELFLALMNSPDLPDIIAKASAGDELTAAETIRLTTLCKAQLNLILMQFQLRKVGIGEEIDLEEEVAEIRELFRSYGGFLTTHWPALKAVNAKDFVAFIDAIIDRKA
jgi:hypothetical protein